MEMTSRKGSFGVFFNFIVFIFLALWVLPVQGQIGVGLEIPQRDYVLYEPIMVEVNLLNSSGKNVIFEENPNWLDLIITRENNELIPATGSPIVDRDIYLDAASTQSLKMNLVYTHEIREPGNYQIQARVRHKGRTYFSGIMPITVVNGAVQWKENFVFINPKTKQEEERVYELVAQKTDKGNRLLARIRDPKKRQVMCCTPVGDLLGYGEPMVKIDSGGSLHILNQNAPRHFIYSKISPEGIREQPRYFLSVTSMPTLIESEGEGIIVVGGNEVGPDGKTLVPEARRPKSIPAIPVTSEEKKPAEEKQPVEQKDK